MYMYLIGSKVSDFKNRKKNSISLHRIIHYTLLYSSTQIIKKCIFSKVQNVPISTAKVAARNVVLNNESCGNLKLKKNISPNQSSKPKFRSEEPAPSDSGGDHRRRIITEEKSKVVAAAWGRNLLDSLPR